MSAAPLAIGAELVPDPWAELAARPHLTLRRAAISDPARYYHGQRAIELCTGLTPVQERRCLWHELVHADRGHRRCSPRDEHYVEREAVRRAIPDSALLWAAERAADWRELAELLQLPERWVRWRVVIAHPDSTAVEACVKFGDAAELEVRAEILRVLREMREELAFRNALDRVEGARS